MQHIKISIREATKNDIPSLSHLMAVLGYPATEAAVGERFETIAKEKAYKTFVAETDGKVVGMAGAFTCFYFEQNGNYVRLAALVTGEAYRNKGIGRTLVEAVEQWAKATGATALILNCGNRDERKAAHEFYGRIGFMPKSTGYVKPLR